MNKKELELYIHIPFCVRKCSYCDFLSAPATEQTREAYMAALFAEIGGRAKDYSDRTVTSVFIGGGTPSLLSGEQIGQLMDRIREQFAMAQDAEITMEVNPGTVSAEKLRNFYTAGINRLSIGMQSAQAEELKNLEDDRRKYHLPGKVRAPGTASNEMCTFLIINISYLQLIPVNVIAYRSQYGSINPAAIVGPGILATAISTLVAIIYCKCKEKPDAGH